MGGASFCWLPPLGRIKSKNIALRTRHRSAKFYFYLDAALFEY